MSVSAWRNYEEASKWLWRHQNWSPLIFTMPVCKGTGCSQAEQFSGLIDRGSTLLNDWPGSTLWYERHGSTLWNDRLGQLSGRSGWGQLSSITGQGQLFGMTSRVNSVEWQAGSTLWYDQPGQLSGMTGGVISLVWSTGGKLSGLPESLEGRWRSLRVSRKGWKDLHSLCNKITKENC